MMARRLERAGLRHRLALCASTTRSPAQWPNPAVQSRPGVAMAPCRTAWVTSGRSKRLVVGNHVANALDAVVKLEQLLLDLFAEVFGDHTRQL